jgi:hypothetical protein
LFQLFGIGIVDSNGKFTTLVVAVEKFATGVFDTSGKFATGVFDTGGKFATDVADTGGSCHWRSWHRWKICHNVAVTGGAP